MGDRKAISNAQCVMRNEGSIMNFTNVAAQNKIKSPSTILHAAISPRTFRSDFISAIMSTVRLFKLNAPPKVSMPPRQLEL